MGDLQERLRAIFVALRRVAIDPKQTPCFLILEPTQGDAGEAFRQALPRVPLWNYEDDQVNLLQVYGDESAFFLSLPDSSIDTLALLGSSLRSARRQAPSVNGVVVMVRAAELANRSEASALGERMYQLLKAWRGATGVHTPLFFLVLAKPSPTGDCKIFEKTVFPFDLWHFPVHSEGGVNVTMVPERIRYGINQLVLERFASAARRVAPPPPSSQGIDDPRGYLPAHDLLDKHRDWFRWMVDLQESSRALNYVLCMSVIAAFGISLSERPSPDQPLPELKFKEADAPILLGTCVLATDVTQAINDLTKDLRANAHDWHWSKVAIAEDRRLGRLGRLGLAYTAVVCLALVLWGFFARSG